ncbi:MAG: triose-phosphate isomerase [Rhodocyclaceae bacterium]
MSRQAARRPWIVGNWKMHGMRSSLATVREIDAAAQTCEGVDVALALPFTLIHAGAQAAGHIAIGGQTCNALPDGPYTGEISAPMLLDAGAGFVILGHSERRTGFGETDEIVRDKLGAALGSGLRALLCVGESRDERETGLAGETVRRQVSHALAAIAGDPEASARLAIAYEPVWAIGTGLLPDADAIAAMHALIRETLRAVPGVVADRVPILYGGSVHEGNAGEILRIPDVDGALVGHASLEAGRFAAIIRAAQRD